MQFRFDDFLIDSDKFELRNSGAVLEVEPLVFDLLLYFAENPQRVVTRDEIMKRVWKGRIVADATISTCIKQARRALGDDGDNQSYIRTVRGRGYEFAVDVSSSEAARPSAVPPAPAPEEAGADDPPPTSRISDPRWPVPAEKAVLAVLPFSNLSADIDEYFADGLTEDIITNLSRFRELAVIGRASTFRFKGQAIELPEVREKLSADYVVEGSVRRAAGRVRITAQLVDAATGFHLWADKYDREMEDIFAVQDEVTRTIAATLGVKLQDVATQRALRKSRAELDAYDCLLRARRYTSMLSAEVHAEARDLLEQATAQDPSHAEAHALLANVYLAEHRFDTNPRPDSISRALHMAQVATRLDPQSAYARCWLGIVHFFRGENDTFKAEVRRALDLNPNDPETLADIGHYLAFMGEFERGLELSQQAQKLNPLHPGWYFFSAARYDYDRRAYEEVLADVQRISMPHFYWTHLLSTAALGQLERPEAAASLAAIYELKPNFSAEVELAKWNAAPEDFDHLMEGLRKAGLDE